MCVAAGELAQERGGGGGGGMCMEASRRGAGRATGLSHGATRLRPAATGRAAAARPRARACTSLGHDDDHASRGGARTARTHIVS